MPVFAAAGGPLIAADHFAYYAGWADKLTGDVVPTWPTPSLDYVTHEPVWRGRDHHPVERAGVRDGDDGRACTGCRQLCSPQTS